MKNIKNLIFKKIIPISFLILAFLISSRISSAYIYNPTDGGGSSGVSSLNGLTGALNLVAGTNITLTPAGSDITIDATGGGGSQDLEQVLTIGNSTGGLDIDSPDHQNKLLANNFFAGFATGGGSQTFGYDPGDNSLSGLASNFTFNFSGTQFLIKDTATAVTKADFGDANYIKDNSDVFSAEFNARRFDGTDGTTRMDYGTTGAGPFGAGGNNYDEAGTVANTWNTLSRGNFDKNGWQVLDSLDLTTPFTGVAFGDAGGNQNYTTFNVQDARKIAFINGLYKGIPGPFEYFDFDIGLLEAGDISGNGQHVKTRLSDPDHSYEIRGWQDIDQTGPTYTAGGGPGLDDMSVVSYGGNTNITYTISIDGLNAQTMGTSTITPGIAYGDTVTQTTGAGAGTNGSVAVDASGIITVINTNVTGPGFQLGQVIENGTGGTATIINAITSPQDTFTWSDSFGNFENFVSINGGPQVVDDANLQPFTIQFGANTGHTLADTWVTSFVTSYGRMFSLMGGNDDREAITGDVDNIGNHVKTIIGDSNHTIDLHGLYNSGESDLVRANFIHGQVYNGDWEGNNNGVFTRIDDSNQNWVINGFKGATVTGPTYSGPSALDDMTVGPWLNNYSASPQIVIDSVALTNSYIGITSVSGVISIGDTITQTTGAGAGTTGISAGINVDTNQYLFHDIVPVGPGFGIGETLTGPSLATATITAVDGGVDTFSSSFNSTTFNPITAPAVFINAGTGFTVKFQNASSHQVGDTWDTTFTLNSGRGEFEDLGVGSWGVGDVDNVGNGTTIGLFDRMGTIFMHGNMGIFPIIQDQPTEEIGSFLGGATTTGISRYLALAPGTESSIAFGSGFDDVGLYWRIGKNPFDANDGSFGIMNDNTGVALSADAFGQIWINNNSYNLPLTDGGLSGNVLTTDGAGNTSFQSIPFSIPTLSSVIGAGNDTGNQIIYSPNNSQAVSITDSTSYLMAFGLPVVDAFNQQLIDSGTNIAQFAWTAAGIQIPKKITSYNGDTTSGNGVASVVCAGPFTGQTSAITGICGVGESVDTTYEAGGWINITAISVNTITVQVTFTDETNTVRTLSFFPQGLTASAIATTGFVALPDMTIRVKAGTTATMKTVVVGAGSQTYDFEPIMKRVN